jgi:hypothetical protein
LTQAERVRPLGSTTDNDRAVPIRLYEEGPSVK